MTATRNDVPYKFPGRYEQWWLDQDGKEVVIDGHRHTIRSYWRAVRHPYPTYRLDVMAIPTVQERRTDWYQNVKAELGDDWFTDVVNSDVELLASVAEQLSYPD